MPSPSRRRPNSAVAQQAKKMGIRLMSGSPRRYKTATSLKKQIADKKRKSPTRKLPTRKQLPAHKPPRKTPKKQRPQGSPVQAKYHKPGRKSPAKSANTAQNRNTHATGNDGNRWRSTRNSNGVYTWKRV